MNEKYILDSFNETLKYLNILKDKIAFTDFEMDYIDCAPLSILANRFNYNKNILSDLNFVYPVVCSVEKAVGELISRVYDISEYTFNEKIKGLILMHSDISENETEKELGKLKLKLSNIKFQALFDFLIELKKIRNDISHLRFESLKYKGELLSNYNTRAQLLFDLFNFNSCWDLFLRDLLEKGRLPYQKNSN